jgi:hypothetical protein
LALGEIVFEGFEELAGSFCDCWISTVWVWDTLMITLGPWRIKYGKLGMHPV